MSNKKVITVLGATGAQGGGLVRAILNDPQSEFKVRAVTRNVNSDKARALATLGAEVVAADLDDAQSLQRAFAGTYGAFCVTFFWEHFSPEVEIAQAKRLAQAAKAANLQHVIWSTLEDSRQWSPLTDARIPTLMGKYKVPHMDAKGEADQLFIDAGVPTTFITIEPSNHQEINSWQAKDTQSKTALRGKRSLGWRQPRRARASCCGWISRCAPKARCLCVISIRVRMRPSK